MRTDRRLWLLFSTAVAFVPLGFVHPMSEAVEYKSGPSNFWGSLFDPHVWAIAGNKANRSRCTQCSS